MRMGGLAALLMAGVLLGGLCAGANTTAKAVVFPDAELEALVRETIAKPVGEITEADLASITELAGPEGSVVDLHGLEACTNLASLALPHNEILDLGPLANLRQLDTLNVIYNDIADVTPLAGIATLRVLYLRGNRIEDISPLAGLTNLVVLSLNENSVSDISAVVGLTNLKTLRLSVNEITDITPLLENPGLGPDDEVSIDRNPLSQEALCLDVPKLEDDGINVDYTGSCTSRIVVFDDPHIEALLRQAVGRPDAPVLDSMLAVLTDFDASNAGIVSPLALGSCLGLERLNLAGNTILDIEFLARLTELRDLDLRNNEIDGLAVLANLNKLTRLDLSDNSIVNVAALAALQDLAELYLAGNGIEDIGALVANAGLAEGDTLDLSRNPLSQQALCVDIPAIEARGVRVYYDGLCVPEEPEPEGCFAAGIGVATPRTPDRGGVMITLLLTCAGLLIAGIRCPGLERLR
ncbi:MAG TPA: leucine-rich repeat domain-containing protein [Candidatus Hydrogenedentes bacterium]|nr:leucine-rich repeat domain-containing protein [Candidatus Hydrogenedentota bacterium]HPG67953.1 leucine-rich repeat domain-containing protein [Candidatus Hydrogenedentota bacterium]